ncbi:MAG: ABC transporter permease [Prevotella sp.]|nr:ABC transporter permease [Prevotella sp.]
MNTILYIWYDELRSLLRDKGVMIFCLFVPLAYPLLYAYVYTNEVVREVPSVVVDQCKSQKSREFIRKVDGTPDVKIIARCASMEEAKGHLQRHEAYGIYKIPDTFDLDIAQGDQTHIGLYCDMSSMLYYKALLLAATDVSLDMNRDIKITHLSPTTIRDEEIKRTPVEYEHINLYNPQSGFASFLIPPVLMLIIQQTLLLSIGMRMGDTREENMGCTIPFDRHYKNAAQIVVGKSAVYLMIYFVMAVYMFTFVHQSFSLVQIGHYSSLIAFIVPFILACIFFAMTLSALIYRREDCILIFVFLSVPLLFLSGISWPGSAIPAFWKYVSWLFPSTFGMNGYVRIMTMGAGIGDIHTEYMALWAQAAFYFGTSCLMYWRNIRRMVALKG